MWGYPRALGRLWGVISGQKNQKLLDPEIHLNLFWPEIMLTGGFGLNPSKSRVNTITLTW